MIEYTKAIITTESQDSYDAREATRLAFEGMTVDQLQAERFKWVAVEAVAKEAYEATRKQSLQALTPVIAELQRRDQVEIDAQCVLLRAKK